jgi:plastocyanin
MCYVRATLSLFTIGAMLAGCGASPPSAPVEVTPTPTATPASVDQAPSVIGVPIIAFFLPDITVATGATVMWNSSHSTPHTITSGVPGNSTGSFDSGQLRTGGSFGFTFGVAGTYPYYCTIHPSSMQGTITVADGTASSTSANSTRNDGSDLGY